MSKIDHIERVEQEGAKYYPRDAGGNVNEWGAILQHQAASFKKMEEEN